MDPAALLTRLAEVIDAHDWDGLAALLHPDFTCTLVHTGEAFDRDQWVRLNADYTAPDGSAQAFAVASFATTADGLITELTEVWTDLDDMTSVLSAPDPVRVDRRTRTRDDAIAWIEWQERNYAEHDFGLWVVETHDGDFVGGLPSQGVARNLGMVLERTAHVHGADAYVFGCRLTQPT